VLVKKNTTYEVADKLDGSWKATRKTALFESTFIYEFEYSGQDAGSCEFYNLLDGEIIVHYTSGVYCVEDDKITIDFYASVDKYGSVSKLTSKRTLTLSYTYDNDNLTLKDETCEYFKTK
jgi:hypothetical protein